MTTQILSGNEAVALGAWESGVKVASAYPGTPSTEILENFARYEGIYAEWAPNEKVALEVTVGASMAGVRTLAAMKHVGLNVAADPLMTLSYTGVKGGALLVCADDPGMHSSQNEQDSRYYARFAQIPLLEPSDSQEAKDMVATALDLSEKMDTPVMLRVTTRIAHSKGIVSSGEPPTGGDNGEGFAPDRPKYCMLPGFAKIRHPLVLKRLAKLKAFAEETPLNRIEWGNTQVGVIAAGISYQYVKEVLPEASVLKLGLAFPLPEEKIKAFAAKVERLLVVEELEPFLEDELKIMGLEVEGKAYFPRIDELNPERVAQGFREAGVLS
ncbi:MAG: indolepyruvate ferredoxin oxidoreductase subunit alpha, partial [Desulfobacterales bacterium]